jgi:hypothetical protein
MVRLSSPDNRRGIKPLTWVAELVKVIIIALNGKLSGYPWHNAIVVQPLVR